MSAEADELREIARELRETNRVFYLSPRRVGPGLRLCIRLWAWMADAAERRANKLDGLR